jgi:hypothetical protein
LEAPWERRVLMVVGDASCDAGAGLGLGLGMTGQWGGVWALASHVVAQRWAKPTFRGLE